MIQKLAIAAASLALLAGCQPASDKYPAARVEALSAEGLEKRQLTIASARGDHRFIVELARTPEQQQRGLMFRQSLELDHGMLFLFAEPREAGFWMRNTLIPLDMIFIRADGTIARIAAMTVPGSLQTISSGEPVTAVLEIAGGRSAALGIAPGDRVRWAN